MNGCDAGVTVPERRGAFSVQRFISLAHRRVSGHLWPILQTGVAAVGAYAIDIGSSVDERPGVKFADADLIGVPQILIAGRRSGEGVMELKDRKSGEREELTVDEAIARLTAH